MATSGADTAPGWARWQGGSLQHDYTMMNEFPYDSRQMTSGPLQRPAMTSHLVMDGNYLQTGHPDSMAPVYAQQSYAYGSLAGTPPLSIRPSVPTLVTSSPAVDHQRYMGQINGSRSYEIYQSPSPTPSSDYPLSSSHVKTEKPGPAKTITLNQTIDPAQTVEFDTRIDELMRTIQKTEHEQMPTPAQSPTIGGQRKPLPSSPSKKFVGKPKWVCDGPNCGKTFKQKTHLEIHRRTHTGERPYQCQYPGCGHCFTQAGNLRTHERRHYEEKPYQCSICGKSFAQRGNVRAHERTHQKEKPFTCRLDDCGKKFSQLGNMKTHQNTFHMDALRDLTQKFARWLEGGAINTADLELFEYFKQHYKNSNKGIKGRGKGRTVAPRQCNPPSRKRAGQPKDEPPCLKREPVSLSQQMYISPAASPISAIHSDAQITGYIHDQRPILQDEYRHMLPTDRFYSNRY